MDDDQSPTARVPRGRPPRPAPGSLRRADVPRTPLPGGRIPGGPSAGGRPPVPVWESPWSRRRVLRALSWLSVAAAVLLAGGTAAGYALVGYYDGNIRRLPDVVLRKPPPDTDKPRPLNVLVVGSDSRAGLTGEEAFQGKGKGFITGQRSDVIILAHVFAGRHGAQLVSIPRDSYVVIPAHKEPKSGRPVAAREAKINEAFASGGPALLVATVEELTKVRVDHYVQVDFRGFKTLVDRLGGVEICLSEPQKDFRSGIDLPAGRQVVRGGQALAFVRQRQGLARGDIDRIERQQLLLGALVRKILSAGTLLNPVRLNGVLKATTSSLQVDDRLSGERLRALAQRFRSIDTKGVVFTTVPIADISGRRRGQSVVLIDQEPAEQLFDRLRRDIAPGPPPAPPAPPSGAPAPPPPPPPPGVEQRTAAENPCAV